ncbi:transglycosylase SLT domain-containing protein [Agaribacterium haliotis]|uniref:transglycosylase SLT domain-containing protein n=1 Tax=Agaribacterium haliotis TaxID=2013869 RepID=UPI0013047188|nr:transglycosylase SLT domain-containing protein [Agaribacterium haliotis]
MLCTIAGFAALTLLALTPVIAASTNIDQQRYHYELAKSALKKGDSDAYARHYAKLGDYPLIPYLDYSRLRKDLAKHEAVDIQAFISRYEDSYLAENLRRRYLEHLSAKKQWPDFLYWYDDRLASEAMYCKHLELRANSGDVNAWDELAELWLQSRSLDKACDPVIKAWRNSEYWRDDYAWQRFLLSMEAGQRSLARYCASLLPKSYQNYVKLVQQLDAKPYLIRNHKNYRSPTLDMQQVIGFGIRRYAKQHPLKALEHWQRYESSRIFNTEIINQTKIALVDRLMAKNELEQVHRLLANSPSIRQSDTIEHLLRRYLREQRWADVVAGIQLLPQEKQQSDRWRYWNARASTLLSPTAIEDAQKTYRELAAKRSFYGFLAADYVGVDYELEDADTQLDTAILEALAQKPALRRAKELWLTGRSNEAYAEWYYAMNQLSARELVAAGQLANSWGWYDRAIQAMIAGKQWDELGIRFPLAYKEHVMNAADTTQLEPALIFAVARQESAMRAKAKSPVGARGLMQLMPATARQTAKKQGIPHRTEDLYKPDHNIKLGSLYLDGLLDQYQGNRILAAAAYNAGPHRVKRWRESSDGLPFDVWIETIPFKETRGYVQNVLTYAVIYGYRMGEPGRMITQKEANSLL